MINDKIAGLLSHDKVEGKPVSETFVVSITNLINVEKAFKGQGISVTYAERLNENDWLITAEK